MTINEYFKSNSHIIPDEFQFAFLSQSRESVEASMRTRFGSRELRTEDTDELYYYISSVINKFKNDKWYFLQTATSFLNNTFNANSPFDTINVVNTDTETHMGNDSTTSSGTDTSTNPTTDKTTSKHSSFDSADLQTVNEVNNEATNTNNITYGKTETTSYGQQINRPKSAKGFNNINIKDEYMNRFDIFNYPLADIFADDITDAICTYMFIL